MELIDHDKFGNWRFSFDNLTLFLGFYRFYKEQDNFIRNLRNSRCSFEG